MAMRASTFGSPNQKKDSPPRRDSLICVQTILLQFQFLYIRAHVQLACVQFEKSKFTN